MRTYVVLSQVGLELSSKDLQSSTLANTVLANQSQHLTSAGRGKSVKLEGVGTITMRSFLLEILGKINNVDGIKGAFLHADTATNAEELRNPSNLGLGVNLNAQLALKNNGTRALALLSATRGLASLCIHDSNTSKAVRHV